MRGRWTSQRGQVSVGGPMQRLYMERIGIEQVEQKGGTSIIGEVEKRKLRQIWRGVGSNS